MIKKLSVESLFLTLCSCALNYAAIPIIMATHRAKYHIQNGHSKLRYSTELCYM